MLFDTPDRVQHMLWRFRDPAHPCFDRDLAPAFATRIEEHYTQCDALLSSAIDQVDEDTLLIVLSDHGFGTFRRAFHTNTWLWQHGLLTLKNNRKPDDDLGEGFTAIDWSRTYAYAVGLGGIYLNFKGRESAGILEEGSEAERVRRAIQTGRRGRFAGHFARKSGLSVDDALLAEAERLPDAADEVFAFALLGASIWPGPV